MPSFEKYFEEELTFSVKGVPVVPAGMNLAKWKSFLSPLKMKVPSAAGPESEETETLNGVGFKTMP